MSKGLIDLVLDSIFNDEWKGRHGEKLTERELKLVQLFGRKGKVLRNVYLPKDNGETSELDVVFITQKGIFIFESKNYSGWIFGDEDGQYWTAMLPNKQKNKFYNPVKQNRTHLKWMKQFVGENVPLFSIIVFSERCDLKKITMHSEDIKVIKRDYTYATVRDIWDSRTDAVSNKTIDELYIRLKELTNVDTAVKAAHIQTIENKYKNKIKLTASDKDSIPENITIIPDTSADTDLKCPKCGNNLVLRIAKKGANAGNQFYGCSNYPKCRYIKTRVSHCK